MTSARQILIEKMDAFEDAVVARAFDQTPLHTAKVHMARREVFRVILHYSGDAFMSLPPGSIEGQPPPPAEVCCAECEGGDCVSTPGDWCHVLGENEDPDD